MCEHCPAVGGTCAVCDWYDATPNEDDDVTDYITSFCPKCGKSQWREHPAKCDACGSDVIPEPDAERRPWPCNDPTEPADECPEPYTPWWVIGVLILASVAFWLAVILAFTTI